MLMSFAEEVDGLELGRVRIDVSIVSPNDFFISFALLKYF